MPTPRFTLDRRNFLKASALGALAAGIAGCESATSVEDENINKALGRLDTFANEGMSVTGTPGIAIAVVHRGEVVYAKGFGVRELGKPELVDADTVFQLASVSKSVGATAIARQVGLGKVSWETKVTDHLPWFALKDAATTSQLTIADTYCHRTGLPGHVADRLEDIGFDQRTCLERLRFSPLKPFRTVYAYTNFGMTAGGLAVAEALKTDWATLSDESIYKPLGMSRTSSRYSDFMSRSNRVSGHQADGGVWKVRSPGRMPDGQAPAASVTSSVNDMARWMKMLLAGGMFDGQRIIEQSALDAMFTAHMETDTGGTYGYGVNVGKNSRGQTAISHSGAFATGASSSFRIVPEMQLGIVCLSNGWPIGVPEIVGAKFFDVAENGDLSRDWQALIGPNFAPIIAAEGALRGKTPPAAPVAAKALTEYTGTYANDFHGPITVEESAGALQLKLGPAASPVVRPLTHWDGDVFTFTLDNENATPGTISQATFSGNTVKLEFYDHDELGTFTK